MTSHVDAVQPHAGGKPAAAARKREKRTEAAAATPPATSQRLLTPTNNITNPVMTRFERTSVLGMRIEQLSRGAMPFVTDIGTADSLEAIAERELLEKRLPFVIKRVLPTGKHELWRVADMVPLPLY